MQEAHSSNQRKKISHGRAPIGLHPELLPATQKLKENGLWFFFFFKRKNYKILAELLSR